MKAAESSRREWIKRGRAATAIGLERRTRSRQIKKHLGVARPFEWRQSPSKLRRATRRARKARNQITRSGRR